MTIDVALIGLDWGTTSLRAYLYDVHGNVVASRQNTWGVRQLPNGGFAAALRAVTAGWPPCTVMAAGMVGSRQGWCEVPYVDVPADTAAIAHGMHRAEACITHALWIAPGLRQRAPADVMRGEETQIIGALKQQTHRAGTARFVLPGTHSKWATVVDNHVVRFDTIMTGEIYALLMKHSILGAGLSLETHRSFSNDAFMAGLRLASESAASGAYSRLFSARALMLDGALETDHVPDFLSGLLIGEEFRIARLQDDDNATVSLNLIGEPALCERYVVAAHYFDYASVGVIRDAAAHGLWELASIGGLISQAAVHVFNGANA